MPAVAVAVLAVAPVIKPVVMAAARPAATLLIVLVVAAVVAIMRAHRPVETAVDPILPVEMVALPVDSPVPVQPRLRAVAVEQADPPTLVAAAAAVVHTAMPF